MALQALYLKEAAQSSKEAAWQSAAYGCRDQAILSFGYELLSGAILDQSRADELISDAAKNWSLKRMAVVDRNLLRLAVHELLGEATPPKVVINEAVDLARMFSADDSSRFINGVLDKISRFLKDGAQKNR